MLAVYFVCGNSSLHSGHDVTIDLYVSGNVFVRNADSLFLRGLMILASAYKLVKGVCLIGVQFVG